MKNTAEHLAGKKREWLDTQRRLLVDAARTAARTQGMNAIHETRVIARRLRAVLGAWRHELHPVLVAQLRFELRDLGRSLAPVRDADTRRHLVAKLTRSSVPDVTAPRSELLARLDLARHEARLAFRALRNAPAWHDRLDRIETQLSDPCLWAIAPPRAAVADEINSATRQLHKLRKQFAGKRPSATMLHPLRIRIKKARYLLEALSEVFATDMDDDLRLLRGMQAVLGNMHDCLQLDSWLAETPSPAATLQEVIKARMENLIQHLSSQLSSLRQEARKRW